jgi:hypothetical protein
MNSSTQYAPESYKRTPQFCGNAADLNAATRDDILLKPNVKRARASSKYDGVPVEDLMELAKGRMAYARLNFIKIGDRFSAIAVLEGVTCCGTRK